MFSLRHILQTCWYKPKLQMYIDICSFWRISFISTHCHGSVVSPTCTLFTLDSSEAITVTEGWWVLPRVLSHCLPWAVASLCGAHPPQKIFTDALHFNPTLLCAILQSPSHTLDHSQSNLHSVHSASKTYATTHLHRYLHTGTMQKK